MQEIQPQAATQAARDDGHRRDLGEDLADQLRRLRARHAEVAARDAHCAIEQRSWDERRTSADVLGNERGVREAEARLVALDQARRRNAATLGRLEVEISMVAKAHADSVLRATERTAGDALCTAVEHLRALIAIDGALMVELRNRWLPEVVRVQNLVADAARAERDADRAAGRSSRTVPRAIDQIERAVPGGLWRLKIVERFAANEPLPIS